MSMSLKEPSLSSLSMGVRRDWMMERSVKKAYVTTISTGTSTSLRRPSRRLSEADKAKIRILARYSCTLEETAVRVGCSTPTVYRVKRDMRSQPEQEVEADWDYVDAAFWKEFPFPPP
ncbi:hypothetical protein H0H92_014422, partial [Tricholoma furcatifolium]